MMYKCIDCIIIYSLSGTQASKEASAYSVNEFSRRGDASSLKVPWSPFLLPLAWLLGEAQHQPNAYLLWQDLEGWGEISPSPLHGRVICRGCSTMSMPDMQPPCQDAFLWARWQMGSPCSERFQAPAPLQPSGLGEASRSDEGAGVDLGLWNLQIRPLPNGCTAWGDAVRIPLLAAKCTSRAWAGRNPKTSVKRNGKISPELLMVLCMLLV